LGVETSVPTCSPRTTRRMFPSASANTWMGRLLSMQRESAVVSITFRPRSIASRCVISVISFAFASMRGSPSRTPSTACFAIRIATSTPCSRNSRISPAIASTVGRSMPYSRSPISASPESFRRTRWKTGSGTEREALELEHLGALLGEGLGDRLRLVVDPGLVEEDAAPLREEALVHHPVDDLLARLLRLRLHLVGARVDL